VKSDKNHREFIEAWRKAARVLHEVRARELPEIDTVAGLQSLLPAFAASVRQTELRPSSGLLEQQRIFARRISR
jgi:hypothetical protein